MAAWLRWLFGDWNSSAAFNGVPILSRSRVIAGTLGPKRIPIGGGGPLVIVRGQLIWPLRKIRRAAQLVGVVARSIGRVIAGTFSAGTAGAMVGAIVRTAATLTRSVISAREATPSSPPSAEAPPPVKPVRVVNGVKPFVVADSINGVKPFVVAGKKKASKPFRAFVVK